MYFSTHSEQYALYYTIRSTYAIFENCTRVDNPEIFMQDIIGISLHSVQKELLSSLEARILADFNTSDSL